MKTEQMNKLIKDRLEVEMAANPIISRGFVTCNNDIVENSAPCLLSGINPSFPKGDEPKTFSYIFSRAIEDENNKGNTYWGKKRKQYCTIYKEMAYLDLFPIRESRQSVFEKALPIELKKDLLEITQTAIEDMKPRLIIHANRASLYYWGLAPQTPWMGYSFELVEPDKYKNFPKSIMTEERLRLFPLYKITGFSDHKERINQVKYPQGTKSSLEGSFFMEYVMEYRKKEDRAMMYTSSEWAEIWKWVKENSIK